MSHSNPPQGDTTINSEVHQILTDFSDGLDFVLEVADDAPLDDPDFFDRPYLDATTALTNLIAQEAKAFGGCRICYGKGYATVRKGTTAKGKTWDLRTQINYCSCDRGKQLQQVVSQEANKARISALKDIAAHAYSTDHVWGFLGTRLAQLTSEKGSSNE